MIDAINGFLSDMVKNHPFIHFTLLALFILGVGYALYAAFFRYENFLAENYGFRLCGLWGKLMLGCVLLYTFVIHVFMQGITAGWGWLSLVDATDFEASARAMVLILPLTAVYFLRARTKIRDVKHAVGATLMMFATAVIGGFLGKIVGMLILFFVVAGFYIRLTQRTMMEEGLKNKGKSGYKCLVCGDIVKSGGRCSCRRLDKYNH